MVVILEEQDRKPNQVGKSKVVGESWMKGKVCGWKRIEAEGQTRYSRVRWWESFGK